MALELDELAKTLISSTSSAEMPHILIVDDDDAIRHLMTEALSTKNYLVDTAETAEIAIKMMTEARYSLILMDINLPGMSGHDLLLHCQEYTPHSAVIMITGAPELDTAVTLMKEGAFDYLAKPIDIHKLFERIKIVLQKRATIEIDPALTPILKNIPPEYNIIKIVCTTETSIILLVEKDQLYYAMKILKYETMDDRSMNKIKRFFREAQLMRSISHPNIVTVYEYRFDHDQLPFILTEYVPTSSLKREMVDKMSFQEKLIFIHKLADALWEIHKKGITHRDIKPSNIMVTSDGDPKITDFGIAGIKDSSLTLTREVLGSPRYMSPEAFVACRDTDLRSDIFSLGLVAYEIFTGQRAFEGNNINQIIHAVCTQKPIRPSKLNSEIPEGLDNILAEMLAKDPEDRYKNTAAVAMDIEAIIKGEDKKPSGFLAGVFKKGKLGTIAEVWKDN